MHHTPSTDTLRVLLHTASPNVTPKSVHEIPSLTPQRFYGVVVSDGRTLLLVMAPPPMSRLLRSEQLTSRPEITVVRWLRDILHDQVALMPKDGQGLEEEPAKASTLDDVVANEQPDETAPYTRSYLMRFLPAVVHSSLSTSEFGTPFTLLKPTDGVPVSTLPAPLTSRGREEVNRQAAWIWRQFCSLTSPSQRFGPSVAVLTVDPDSPYFDAGCGMAKNSSSDTWSEALHAMLESILRDGEDMSVVLPYSTIRRHFRRLGHVLDGVTVPHLTLLDGTEDFNVLVKRSPADPDSVPIKPGKPPASGVEHTTSGMGDGPERKEGNQPPERHEKGEKSITTDCGAGCYHYPPKLGTPPSELVPSEISFQVTGLRDWSNCVFGDPLLAGGVRGAEGVPERLGLDLDTDNNLVQDKEYANIRLMFYQVYHAVVCIVKEFYRPRHESRDHEKQARKCLGEALMKLDGIDDVPKRKHRRPSGVVSPAKKRRSGYSRCGDGPRAPVTSEGWRE